MTTGNVARAWPHTDSGVISLLLQDEVGGLELEDRQNPSSFIRLSSNGTMEMIVNVADTLERWTNGVLRAGLHRVNNPENASGKGHGSIEERFFVVLFFKANENASLGPVSCFITPQRPAEYSFVTALQYLQQVNGKLYAY